MTTRRQHYVWRNYLKPWATNEQIWCLRDGKKFLTNLMNIGQERDFYAVKDITDHEIDYIIKITEHLHNGILNKHNKEFINLYRDISALRVLQDANEDIKELLIQFEENMLSDIEINGMHYLKLLYDSKTDFFEDDSHRAKFSFFITMQFIRTKRMSEKVRHAARAFSESKDVNIDNIWPIEKYIYANSMAFSLFSDKRYKIYLLKNKTQIPFITGDQPIFNMHGIGIGNALPSDSELYYPLSPTLAALISKREKKSDIELDQVHHYNSSVKEMSLEQIYSNTELFL